MVEEEVWDPLVVVDPEVDGVEEPEGMGDLEAEALWVAVPETEGEREEVSVPPRAPTPSTPAVVVTVGDVEAVKEEDTEVEGEDFKELEAPELPVLPMLPL